jgi:hypothetical protein
MEISDSSEMEEKKNLKAKKQSKTFSLKSEKNKDRGMTINKSIQKLE